MNNTLARVQGKGLFLDNSVENMFILCYISSQWEREMITILGLVAIFQAVDINIRLAEVQAINPW